MRYTVRVSCYGDRWMLHAPAFGITRVVADKHTIRDEAEAMIARCGSAPECFGVNLVLGRKVDPRYVR